MCRLDGGVVCSCVSVGGWGVGSPPSSSVLLGSGSVWSLLGSVWTAASVCCGLSSPRTTSPSGISSSVWTSRELYQPGGGRWHRHTGGLEGQPLGHIEMGQRGGENWHMLGHPSWPQCWQKNRHSGSLLACCCAVAGAASGVTPSAAAGSVLLSSRPSELSGVLSDVCAPVGDTVECGCGWGVASGGSARKEGSNARMARPGTGSSPGATIPSSCVGVCGRGVFPDLGQ